MKRLLFLFLLFSCGVAIAQRKVVPAYAHRTLYLVDCKDQTYIVVVKINDIEDINKIKIFYIDNIGYSLFRDLIIYTNDLKHFFTHHKRLHLDSLSSHLRTHGVLGLELSTNDYLHRRTNVNIDIYNTVQRRYDILKYWSAIGILGEFTAEFAFNTYYYLYQEREYFKNPDMFPILYAPDAPINHHSYRSVLFLEKKQSAQDSASGILPQCIPLNYGRPFLPIDPGNLLPPYSGSPYLLRSPIRDFAWEDSLWWLTTYSCTKGTLQWAAGIRPDSLSGYPKSPIYSGLILDSTNIPLHYRLLQQEALRPLKYLIVNPLSPVLVSYPLYLQPGYTRHIWREGEEIGFYPISILFKGTVPGDTSRNFTERELNSRVFKINSQQYNQHKNFYYSEINKYSFFYHSDSGVLRVNCESNSFDITQEDNKKLYEIIHSDVDFLTMNGKKIKAKYKIYSN